MSAGAQPDAIRVAYQIGGAEDPVGGVLLYLSAVEGLQNIVLALDPPAARAVGTALLGTLAAVGAFHVDPQQNPWPEARQIPVGHAHVLLWCDANQDERARGSVVALVAPGQAEPSPYVLRWCGMLTSLEVRMADAVARRMAEGLVQGAEHAQRRVKLFGAHAVPPVGIHIEGKRK